MSEWTTYQLGDIVENFDARRIPVRESDRRAGPYPYYGASGIIDWIDDYIFDGEYLLIAEDGENLRTCQTPIAFMASGKFWVNNHAHIVRGNRHADTKFLLYLLSQTDISGYLTGSTIPKLSQASLNRINVEIPEIEVQREIAHILGTLDDKIDLNRKMNATLEAMARALFKSWFVDFDPVRAKAEGRDPAGMDAETAALFPDAFEDSPLGEIPRGWRVGTLGEVAEYVLGGDWGKSEPSSETPVPVHCIRGADIPDLQAGGIGAMPTRYLKSTSASKRSLKHGDLVIEISGGSPTQSTGRVVRLHQSLLDHVPFEVSCSNFCRLVRLQTPELSSYAYFWLRWLYATDALLPYETGTTGIKNFAYTVFSDQHRMLIPNRTVLEAFDRTVSPMVDQMQANGIQSLTLAEMRDALLPRLMRGELI